MRTRGTGRASSPASPVPSDFATSDLSRNGTAGIIKAPVQIQPMNYCDLRWWGFSTVVMIWIRIGKRGERGTMENSNECEICSIICLQERRETSSFERQSVILISSRSNICAVWYPSISRKIAPLKFSNLNSITLSTSSSRSHIVSIAKEVTTSSLLAPFEVRFIKEQEFLSERNIFKRRFYHVYCS